MQALLDSVEFAQQHEIDTDLFALATRNFDDAILRLPVGQLARQRAEFERLQLELLDNCSKEELGVCYSGGSGCSVPCLQRVAAAERTPRQPPSPPASPLPPLLLSPPRRRHRTR